MEINGREGTCCDSVKRAAEKKKKKKKSICRTRNKADVAVFPQLKMEEKDIDLEKQFFQEKWRDDNECMWLSNSSASSSPSSFFEEYRFSALSVDDWVISWLSTLADSYLYLDKSAKNPEEDPLKLTSHQDTQNDVVSVSDSENSRFSSEDSCLVFSENSRWVSDSTELHSEATDLEEPLFWPSEWKSEWSSPGTWKCFSMSPRKGIPDEKFSSEMLDCKQNPIPQLSRLRNSSKISDDIQGAEDRRKIVPIPEACLLYRDLLEDDITRNQQVSIESLLGLGEFDGHEGLDSEFNDDVFSMDDDSL